MKTINKLLISTSLIAATALQAVTFEYPSLYKDPRLMGMGGANIAVGGEASALFSNPAGLSSMDSKEGIEIDLLNINLSVSENTLDLIDALDAATTDTQTLTALETYQGSNNHITLNDYSSLSYKGKSIAWSVGVLAGTQLNLQTHALGSSSGLLDVNGYVLAGLVTGISYDYSKNLHLGLGAKVLQGKSMSAALTLSEVLNLSNNNDASTYLEDTYMTDFDTTVYDVGVIYDMDKILPYGKYWHPSVGLSLLDIGDTKLGNYGTIPSTLNLGFSLKPDFPILSNWIIALDYVDLLDNYDDNYDADMSKKIRFGAKVSLFDNRIIRLAGSAGMYNSDSTYGIELQLLSFLTLNYSSYAEAIGAYADQNLDRRHNLSIAIGW